MPNTSEHYVENKLELLNINSNAHFQKTVENDSETEVSSNYASEIDEVFNENPPKIEKKNFARKNCNVGNEEHETHSTCYS